MRHTDHIISGEKYLADTPNFKLVGRDEELHRLFGILLRKKSNSVIISGPGGAGASAICKGLQSAKTLPDTPLDIAEKRLFWLNTDSLFASGDSVAINQNYENLVATLKRTPQAVLVIDDFKDFIEACRNSGCSNLINSLMHSVKAGDFQAVLESRDEDLDSVMKAHSDMKEFFTLLDIPEPKEENLKLILETVVPDLVEHHGIKISSEAVEAAIELTSKYRANDPGLMRAQPERSITLLDRALTKYRQDVHSKPEGVDELNMQLEAVQFALKGESIAPALKDKSKEELETLEATILSDIDEATLSFNETRSKIEAYRQHQLKGEQLINDALFEIEQIKEKEKERHENLNQQAADKTSAHAVNDFVNAIKSGGFDSNAIEDVKAKIVQYEEIVKEQKGKHDALLAKVNSNFALTKEHVYEKFSGLSGIPVNKLNQDERIKLLNLDKTLSARVFDQGHVITPLSNAVRAGRLGLKDQDKPQGAFFFLGPSGVGKTELAKALTHSLLDDESALLRFDMADYQEKHAVAKLIGAPPGYEGFEVGGILTNAMRRNPRRIILFDEVEKAHPDVFDVLLQVVDDARLSDNVGRVVSFSDAVVILTSNIGSEHFLNPDLTYEQANDLAMKALNEKFRPEFLNRFNGRRNIKSFNRLSNEAIEKIITRELGEWNKKVQNRGLTLYMSPENIKAMVEQEYDPVSGARGPKGYLESYMQANLSMTILSTPDAQGVMEIIYDPDSRDLIIKPPKSNDNAPVLAGEKFNQLSMEG